MLEQMNETFDKDPELLLEQFRAKIDSRTCRLFAAACCRRVWNYLSDELRTAVEVAEGFTEGKVSDDMRVLTYRRIESGCGYVDGDSSASDRFKEFAREAVLSSLFGDGDYPPIPTYAVTCAIGACSLRVVGGFESTVPTSGYC